MPSKLPLHCCVSASAKTTSQTRRHSVSCDIAGLMSSPFLGMFFLEDQPQLPAAHTLISQGSWCFSYPQQEPQGFYEKKAQTK